MVTRKNRVNSFNNVFHKRKLSIHSKTYHNWLKRTFVRTVISVILLMLVLLIQMLNFESPKKALNYVETKLEYNADIRTYLVEAKKLSSYIAVFGDKAIGAIKIEDRLDKRFLPPVDGKIITYFDENIGETQNTSKGLIFASVEGSDIYSVDNGVIIDVGSNKSIGNYIIIKHKGELLSVYKYVGTNYVEINQKVEQGQVIGTSSEKLLLEVWYRNEPIDPIKYMNVSIQQL